MLTLRIFVVLGVDIQRVMMITDVDTEGVTMIGDRDIDNLVVKHYAMRNSSRRFPKYNESYKLLRIHAVQRLLPLQKLSAD